MSCPIKVKRYCVKPYERKGSPVKGYCVSEHDRKCKLTPTVLVHRKSESNATSYQGGPSKRLARINSIQGSQVGVKGNRYIYRGDKGIGGMMTSNDLYTGEGKSKTAKELGYSFNTAKKSGNNVVIKPRKYKIRR